MIPKPDQWGPFAPDLDPAERRARLRSLRAIVRLLAGPRGAELDLALAQAEHDQSELVPALAALNALAPLDRRRILSTYAGLTRPATPTRGTAKHGARFLSVLSRSDLRRDPRLRLRLVPRPHVHTVAARPGQRDRRGDPRVRSGAA